MANQFSTTNLTNVLGLNPMNLAKSVPAYPTTIFPSVVNHHTANCRSFNIENLAHYLRIIMFGDCDIPTNAVLTFLTSGANAVQSEARTREHLTSKNLFHNDFLVISISRAVEKMASTPAAFLHDTTSRQ
jgi:hypothetical protein